MQSSFYFSDSRENIEANLGYKGGKLGEWVDLHDDRHRIFLCSDSVFTDVIVGGKVGGTTFDGFNIFMSHNKEHCKLYDSDTGRRSDLTLTIYRQHRDRLFNIAPCIIHGIE